MLARMQNQYPQASAEFDNAGNLYDLIFSTDESDLEIHLQNQNGERPTTAASRRSLGRVSVPMWPVTLSGRLWIVGLVSRYPTNYLIRRGSISHHRSFSHRTMRYCALMRY